MSTYISTKATEIIDILQNLLYEHKINIPTPEDDKLKPEDKKGLYGSNYTAIHEKTEKVIKDLCELRKTTPLIVIGYYDDVEKSRSNKNETIIYTRKFAENIESIFDTILYEHDLYVPDGGEACAIDSDSLCGLVGYWNYIRNEIEMKLLAMLQRQSICLNYFE